ncbi:uncharacterized protein LOC134352456 [Mobula hypostoma]|uniref:uncharacterized protein LOC134352456 n=1 Tax=Mobula hypostoma TaxID=723540 RepID=UPI002FC314A0
MKNCLTLLLIIAFLLDWSLQDSVEQSVDAITIEEESNVTLNCTLQTSGAIPYGFWYRQRPGQRPEYLFRIIAGKVERNKDVTDRLNVSYDSSKKYTELSIKNATITDSATYLCAMSTQCFHMTIFKERTVVNTQQSWKLLRKSKNKQSQHRTGQRPQYLNRILAGTEYPNEDITKQLLASDDKCKHNSELSINNAIIIDSATYPCAMSTRC